LYKPRKGKQHIFNRYPWESRTCCFVETGNDIVVKGLIRAQLYIKMHDKKRQRVLDSFARSRQGKY